MSLALLFSPDYIEPEWIDEGKETLRRDYDKENKKTDAPKEVKETKRRPARKQDSDKDRKREENQIPLPSTKLLIWLDTKLQQTEKSLQALNDVLNKLEEQEFLKQQAQLQAMREAIYQEIERARRAMEDEEFMMLLMLC